MSLTRSSHSAAASGSENATVMTPGRALLPVYLHVWEGVDLGACVVMGAGVFASGRQRE